MAINKKILFSILGVLLIIGLIFIVNEQFTITGIQTTYNLGDNLRASFVAFVGDTAGDDCDVTWTLSKNAFLGDTIIKQGTTSLDNICYGLAGCSPTETIHQLSQSGDYTLTAAYTCDRKIVNPPTGSWVNEPHTMYDDEYLFRVAEASSSYIEFAYKGCGDTSTTNNNYYWYDSNDVRGDYLGACDIDSDCKVDNSGNPYCTVKPSNYVEEYERRCYGTVPYWYDSNGERTNSIGVCDAGEECKSGYCVDEASNEIPYSCTPGAMIAEECVGNSYVVNSCSTDGVHVTRNIVVCPSSQECSTAENGCVLPVGSGLPDDTIDDTIVDENIIDTITNEELCLSEGYLWDSENKWCYEATVTNPEEDLTCPDGTIGCNTPDQGVVPQAVCEATDGYKWDSEENLCKKMSWWDKLWAWIIKFFTFS